MIEQYRRDRRRQGLLRVQHIAPRIRRQPGHQDSRHQCGRGIQPPTIAEHSEGESENEGPPVRSSRPRASHNKTVIDFLRRRRHNAYGSRVATEVHGTPCAFALPKQTNLLKTRTLPRLSLLNAANKAQCRGGIQEACFKGLLSTVDPKKRDRFTIGTLPSKRNHWSLDPVIPVKTGI